MATARTFLLAGIAALSAQAALAAPIKWESGNTDQGKIAVLRGHDLIPVIVLTCDKSGDIRMWAKLAQKIKLPKPAKTVQFSVSGNAQAAFGSLTITLPPNGSDHEFAGPINTDILDLLGGADKELNIGINIDGSDSWLVSNQLPLNGSSAAVRGVREDCAARSGGATTVAASGAGDEAAVRKAINDSYQTYRYDLEKAPKSLKFLAFSPELQKYIDRATDNGALDYDPFCQCQDFDQKRFRHSIVSLTFSGGKATAQIDVAAVGGPATRIKMILVKGANGAWATDDIIDEGGSLKQNARDAEPGSWGMF